jgi:hypothetical protein
MTAPGIRTAELSRLLNLFAALSGVKVTVGCSRHAGIQGVANAMWRGSVAYRGLKPPAKVSRRYAAREAEQLRAALRASPSMSQRVNDRDSCLSEIRFLRTASSSHIEGSPTHSFKPTFVHPVGAAGSNVVCLQHIGVISAIQRIQ